MPLDLKSTINLPKTAFPMEANLPVNEPKMLARWEEMRLYDCIREAKAGAPAYVLHDGLSEIVTNGKDCDEPNNVRDSRKSGASLFIAVEAPDVPDRYRL